MAFVPTGYRDGIDHPKSAATKSQDFIEVEVDDILIETERAIWLFDGDEERWVPKSCLKPFENGDFEHDGYVQVVRWFAEKEGWV